MFKYNFFQKESVKMKNLKTVIKHIAILLALCLVVGMVGCTSEQVVVSDPEGTDQNILYGNAVDTEDDDDEDVEEGADEDTQSSSNKDDNKNDKTGSGDKSGKNDKNSSNNKNGTADKSDKGDNGTASTASKGDKNNTSSGNNASGGNAGAGLVNQGGNTSSNKNNTTSGSGNKNNNTGTASSNKGTAGNVGTPSEEYKPDEEETKSYLDTVPKNLKGKTVRVLIWWPAGVTETAKAEAFEKATGIKIKFVQTGLGGEYVTKLNSLIQQKNSPDLACIGQENFPSIIMQNMFQTLDVAKLDLSDPIYDKDTMNYFKYQGKYYGAMIKSSTMVTFYATFFNRDMFKKYGVKNPYELWQEGNWNWNTFVSTAQDIKKKANLSSAVGCDYGGYYIVQSAGTDAVEFDDGKIINNCNDPLLETAWKFKNDLKDKYALLDGGYTNFMGGAAAMLLTGNYIAQRGDTLDQQANFDWAMAPLPCPEGQETIVPSAVKLWGIPRGAKNAEAAGYWLRYWLDSSFDPVDKPLWSNDEAAQFNNWLWEQPKQFTNFTGIVSYGGNYSWETMANDLSMAGDNVKSVLDSWSGTIDNNIAKIMKDFGGK